MSNNNTLMQETATLKFLRVALNKNCNWKAHIEKLCSNIISQVYFHYRLKQISGKSVALMLHMDKWHPR